jgi:hypothetical protein
LTFQDQRPRDEVPTDHSNHGGGPSESTRARLGPRSHGAGLPASDDGVGNKEDVLDSLHGWPSFDGVGPSAPHPENGSGAVVDQEIAELVQENENLRIAIDSRAVIEQAKGALMLRYGVDQDAAFAVLKRWSQDSNIKLHTVAEILVDWAAGNDPHPASADQPELAERLETDLAALFGVDPPQAK